MRQARCGRHGNSEVPEFLAFDPKAALRDRARGLVARQDHYGVTCPRQHGAEKPAHTSRPEHRDVEPIARHRQPMIWAAARTSGSKGTYESATAMKKADLDFEAGPLLACAFKSCGRAGDTAAPR